MLLCVPGPKQLARGFALATQAMGGQALEAIAAEGAASQELVQRWSGRTQEEGHRRVFCVTWAKLAGF